MRIRVSPIAEADLGPGSSGEGAASDSSEAGQEGSASASLPVGRDSRLG